SVRVGITAFRRGGHADAAGAGGGRRVVSAAALDRERHRRIRSQPGAARLPADRAACDGDPVVVGPGSMRPAGRRRTLPPRDQRLLAGPAVGVGFLPVLAASLPPLAGGSGGFFRSSSSGRNRPSYL